MGGSSSASRAGLPSTAMRYVLALPRGRASEGTLHVAANVPQSLQISADIPTRKSSTFPRRVTEQDILLSHAQLLETTIALGPRVQIRVGQNWPSAWLVGTGASFPRRGSGCVLHGGRVEAAGVSIAPPFSEEPAHPAMHGRITSPRATGLTGLTADSPPVSA